MKTLFVSLLFFSSILWSTTPPDPAVEEYPSFIAQCIKKENVAECVALMDRLIKDGEHGVVDEERDLGLVEGTTSFGLRIEFSTTRTDEVILYYLRVSRGGKLLQYSDAVKYVALFTDRAGLTHPVEVTEGDKYSFCAQWLIKPSTWKKMHKMMLQVRTENRAETDPEKAFVIAIEHELDARSSSQYKN